MTAVATRRVGWGLIALLWLTAAYLLVYYVAVLTLGPDHLFRLLGESAYNTLVPVGGFDLLLAVVVFAVLWVLPFLIAFVPISLTLRHAGHVRRQGSNWAAAVVAGALTVSLPFVILDGWPWALMPLVWEDDTEFAPGYSAMGFWLVRVGMTPADVQTQVGPPLERYPIREPGAEAWRWTRSPHDQSYRERVVIFRGGRVAEKHSGFYID